MTFAQRLFSDLSSLLTLCDWISTHLLFIKCDTLISLFDFICFSNCILLCLLYLPLVANMAIIVCNQVSRRLCILYTSFESSKKYWNKPNYGLKWMFELLYICISHIGWLNRTVYAWTKVNSKVFGVCVE